MILKSWCFSVIVFYSLFRNSFICNLKQAVLLSLTTTGFPNMIAALGWVNEVLEKHLKEKI